MEIDNERAASDWSRKLRPKAEMCESSVMDRSLVENKLTGALASVLNELKRQQVSYCYWKSTNRLPGVFAGEGDVDLLIARLDQHRAQEIFLAQRFKLFPSVAFQDHPAIVTYLGYDELSGKIIHLHVHFRLIIGERLIQNYRLPWEDTLLARRVLHPKLPIYVLDPTSEALLLVVRAALEFSRLDPVSLRAWEATSSKFELDRKSLSAKVDREELRRLTSELLTEGLADIVEHALYNDEPLESRKEMRRLIRAHLACYRSYNAVEYRLRSVGRSVAWLAGNLNKRFLHAPRTWNRRTPGGGCMIAIIGLDGSGKSTLRAAILGWLGAKIDVVPIYFGTGDGRPSLLLWPLKMMMPLATLLIRAKPRVASHGKASGRPPGLFYSVLLTFWACAVALDKWTKLIAARRGTNRGLVILTDRYPQNQIRRYNDGPLLTRLEWAPSWLRRFEAGVYANANRPPPDLVLKLMVTSATAANREPTMDPVVIDERIEALKQLDFSGARVVAIDAEQPLEEVIRAAKREIWGLL